MKKDLRKQILTLRDSFDKKELEEYSKIICKKLEQYTNKNIALYYPIRNEVNCLYLLDTSNNTSLPKTYKSIIKFIKWHNEPLEKSKSLSEPISNEEVIPDIVITPIVAADKNRNRIGYGKGFYDRAIEHYKQYNTKFIGIAYEFQIVENIMSESHDQKLDMIITEKNEY